MTSLVKDRMWWITAGLVLLMFILYTLLSYWTPLAFDDYVFMSVWKEVNGDQSVGLSSLFDFWREIRLEDNGRLANTLAPLFTMVSPWRSAFPFLTGLFSVAIIIGVSFVSFSRKGLQPFYLALVWGCCLFMLPWRNSLFVADYSLNYIWAAALTLIFMIWVMRCESRGWTSSGLAVALALAFLAGAWHEGFAVPALGGFALLTAFRISNFHFESLPPHCSRFWWGIGLFYFTVALFFYLCPGLLARTSRDLGEVSVGMESLKIVFDLLPVVLAFIIICVYFVTPPFRRLLFISLGNPWFVLVCGVTFVGTLLSLIFKHQPRSAFWPDIMGIIMILLLTFPVWRRLGDSRFRGYLTLIATAVCLYPFSYILPMQLDYHREAEAILEKMEASESGTVFHDIIPPFSMPVFALKIPSKSVWMEDFQYRSLRQFIGKDFPAVVPEVLKEGWRDKAVCVGDSSGLVRVGDYFLLTRDFPLQPTTEEVSVTLKNGETLPSTALLLPFISSEDDTLSFVTFHKLPSSEVLNFTLE